VFVTYITGIFPQFETCLYLLSFLCVCDYGIVVTIFMVIFFSFGNARNSIQGLMHTMQVTPW
jgi:hypothetical protein